MLTFRSADCWLRWGRIVLTMALSFTLIACILLNQILVRINVVLLLPWNCPTFCGLLLNSKIVQLFVSPERSTSILSCCYWAFFFYLFPQLYTVALVKKVAYSQWDPSNKDSKHSQWKLTDGVKLFYISIQYMYHDLMPVSAV